MFNPPDKQLYRVPNTNYNIHVLISDHDNSDNDNQKSKILSVTMEATIFVSPGRGCV